MGNKNELCRIIFPPGEPIKDECEGTKIKFEVFPGKTASQVSGFTEDTKIY